MKVVKKDSFFKAIITGGQILTHNWVMWKQVMRRAFKFSFLFCTIVLGFYGWYVYPKIPNKTKKLAWVWFKSSFYYDSSKSDKEQLNVKVSGTMPSGKVINLPVPIVYKHPQYIKSYIDVKSIIYSGIRVALVGVLLIFIITALLYLLYGRKQKETKHIRGTVLVTHKELKKALIKKAKLDRKKFGGSDV